MSRTKAVPVEIEDSLLSPVETMRMVGGLSRATLRRRVLEGSFPRPVTIGRTKAGAPARVAWSRRTILEWCAARIAEARA